MWTNVPGDLATCPAVGPVCGLMYLMTWRPVCHWMEPECGLIYLVTWPPVCQEGQSVD